MPRSPCLTMVAKQQHMTKKNKWMVNQYPWTSTTAPVRFSLQRLKNNCQLQLKRSALSYLSILFKRVKAGLKGSIRPYQTTTRQLASSYSWFGAASFQFTQLNNKQTLESFLFIIQILHKKKILAQQHDTLLCTPSFSPCLCGIRPLQGKTELKQREQY